MKPNLRTVGCFIEYNGKFIILLRHPDKSHGNMWGLPAGKVEKGETDLDAISRETYEETGIRVAISDFELIGVYEFSFSDINLTFPTYRVTLNEHSEIKLSPKEHQDYRWVTGDECFNIPNLIEGLHDLLKITGYVKA